MSLIEQPLQYRYMEMAYTIINNMVDAAFVASRYATQPPESTEAYLNRLNLTQACLQQRYVQILANSIESMVVSPENPTELQLEQGVGKLDWDAEYNDPYESAMDVFNTTLGLIAHTLADPAFELNAEAIKTYFKEN